MFIVNVVPYIIESIYPTTGGYLQKNTLPRIQEGAQVLANRSDD